MENTEYAQWYVMRDLKRCNAKKPAYKQLQEAGVKVFVPLKWQIILQKDKRYVRKFRSFKICSLFMIPVGIWTPLWKEPKRFNTVGCGIRSGNL